MPDDYFRQPARITNTFLGFEDHGIFTAYLSVDFGDSASGIGNYNLGPVNEDAAAKFLMGILNACDVTNWEKIKGCIINVLYEKDPTFNSRPVGIEPMSFNRGSRFIFRDAFEDDV